MNGCHFRKRKKKENTLHIFNLVTIHLKIRIWVAYFFHFVLRIMEIPCHAVMLFQHFLSTQALSLPFSLHSPRMCVSFTLLSSLINSSFTVHSSSSVLLPSMPRCNLLHGKTLIKGISFHHARPKGHPDKFDEKKTIKRKTEIKRTTEDS